MKPKHLLTVPFSNKKDWGIPRNFTSKFLNLISLLLLIGCLMSFRPPGNNSVVNLVVSSPTCFTDLDGSANDEDGVADGTLTVSSLTIQSTGSILYNDPGNTCSNTGIPNDPAGAITIVVSGDVDIAGSINTENTIQAGTGGDITLTVGGSFSMASTGLISSSNLTSTTGDRSAGDIKIDVTNAITMVPGSEIRANSAHGNGGDIELISYTDNIHIDGEVNSHSISQQSGSGNNQAHGGMIWIQAQLSVLISDEGVVSSAGGDPGADLVHICGCNVTIYGLVESTGAGHAIPHDPPNHLDNTFRPDKPSNSTGGVEVWACNSLLIDASGTHNGEINANIGSQGGGTGASWIDLFIQTGDITIIGNTSGNYAVHANGTAGTNDSGGVVTLKALAGNIFLSNLALQASALGSGGTGGVILAEAKQDIVLTSATLQAKGAVTGGAPHGGQISLRSYGTGPSTGSIVADASSTLDVTGDSGDGEVNLSACGTVGFPPGNIVPGTIVPNITHACGGAPDIATTQPYVEFCCCCSGEITITKVLFGAEPSSDWHYTSDIPGHTSFTLPAAGGSVTFHNVQNGPYTVTETNQESPLCPDQHLNYRVSNTCQASDNDTLTATITVANCQPSSCTFTNRAPDCIVCEIDADAGPDQALCDVTSVTLAGNNPSSGTGTWTKVSGTGGTITSPNSYNTTVTGLTPGVYVFKWKIVDGVCKDSDNVQITIYAKITAYAGPDQSLCNTTTATLAGNNPSPGTGEWTKISGTGGTITNPALRNTTVTGLSNGVYVFQWKITNGECKDSDRVQITIQTCVCLGGGGGLTPGFWSNKNGQALITSADLCYLNSLCLRNANGTDFDPVAGCPSPTNPQKNAGKSAFKNWLLNGTATNMAYMLSVQFSAMTLNVAHGFVNGSAIVYAPGGIGNTGIGNNYISINDLLALANTALCNDGYTPSGDANRATQEAIKNALDRANNNLNFVQTTCNSINSLTQLYSYSRTQRNQISESELSVKAYPNPTTTHFTLKIQTDNIKDPITVRIVDVYGRVVQTFTKLYNGQTLQLGNKYISGMYIAELIQGKNHQQVKLIKQ
jgi:hypothetical protein